MSKENTNWEPDIRKGLDTANKIKNINEQLKSDADNRKIGGFNPGDTSKDSSTNK